MEFMRTESDSPFYDEDEEIVNSYLVWGEVAIHYAEIYGRVGRQKDMSGFLLSIVKSIFMEMVSMDALIIKIMNFAQKLVSADRASLFLVDTKTNQLYARIFDVSGGKGSDNTADGLVERDFTKEIRYNLQHCFL
jgi:cAMP and cAMP-inhibited cGMP 3',5'-cyclic phosphodiesterase 10